MKKTPLAKKAAKSKPAKKATKKTTAKKSPTSRAAKNKKATVRADLGAPIDGFFRKQPGALRSILDALRTLVEQAAPDATSSLKWGMPFFAVGGHMVCAFGGHKAHVNLILPGPPGTFADSEGMLVGDGKTGRRLVIKTLAELPRDAVRGWLRTAVARARSGQSMVLS
jgi:hypothetical protein